MPELVISREFIYGQKIAFDLINNRDDDIILQRYRDYKSEQCIVLVERILRLGPVNSITSHDDIENILNMLEAFSYTAKKKHHTHVVVSIAWTLISQLLHEHDFLMEDFASKLGEILGKII